MRFISFLLFSIFLMVAPVQTLPQTNQPSNPKIIVILGSSVAAGWVTSYQEKYDFQDGYAARLGRLLEPSGWQVINISIPGFDTRQTIERFDSDVLPLNPEIVFIGLSMANEGLETGNPDSVSQQYESGIKSLIGLCEANGIKSVVGLCYSNNNYTPGQYEYLKRMNILINSWGVPCVNFLGALDDGNGHFPDGCTFDPGHPDDLGHEELFYAFVPDLFDAIEEGREIPSIQKENVGSITLGTEAEFNQISYIPAEVMHSFSFGFSFKAAGKGVLATVKLPDAVHEILLDKEGFLVYQTPADSIITNFRPQHDQWIKVMLAHGYLPKKTDFYINGSLVGRLEEQLEPVDFTLGHFPGEAAYKDLLIYRGALNSNEVSALHEGKPMNGSMELYAPLDDVNLAAGCKLYNLALSLGAARLDAPDDDSLILRLTDKINKATMVRANELRVENKQPIQVDPTVYKLYVGSYEIEPGDNFVVEVENDVLYLVDKGTRTELLPESDYKFFIRYPADLTVRFEVDDQRMVSGLVLSMNGREMRAKKVE